VTTVPVSARADTPARRAEAASLFDQGIRLADRGDARGALASFRGAYDRDPHFRVLYNIGQICARLGDSPCAIDAYRRYLRDGGEAIGADRREAVEQQLEVLVATLGAIQVRSSAKGALVKLDDVDVGRTPLTKPIPTSVGVHSVKLVVGSRTATETVNVAKGRPAVVTIEPPSGDEAPSAAPEETTAPLEPGAAEAPAPAPPRAEHAEAGKKTPLVPWVVTGALVAGTAVSAFFASRAYASLQSKRNAYPVSRDELDGAQASARDLFLVTSGLAAATVVSGALSAYLTFAQSSSPAAGTPSVRVAVGPRGALVLGSFR
jgi:hypothetical protein